MVSPQQCLTKSQKRNKRKRECDNNVGKKLMRITTNKGSKILIAYLNEMKEYSYKVDGSDCTFVDYSVKVTIHFIWSPTQKLTSIGLLPGNEEVADTMAAEEMDNVETNEPVFVQPEDKDVEEDEKQGESVELNVNMYI